MKMASQAHIDFSFKQPIVNSAFSYIVFLWLEGLSNVSGSICIGNIFKASFIANERAELHIVLQ